MSLKPKRDGSTELQATSTQAETGVSVKDSAHDEEIRRRAYEIYLERGQHQAVSWTIGFKPNANSKVRRFRARRQARKGSTAFAGQHHLAGVFRRITGTPPSTYRRSL